MVLTRKAGEVLVIGSDIEIVVLEIDKGKVRLGITAPSDVLVFRKEILNRIPSRERE